MLGSRPLLRVAYMAWKALYSGESIVVGTVPTAAGGERGVTGDQGSGKVNRESCREIATNGVAFTYRQFGAWWAAVKAVMMQREDLMKTDDRS